MTYSKVAKKCYRDITKNPIWHRMTFRQKMQIRIALVRICTRSQVRYWKFCRDFSRRRRMLKRGKLSTKN